MERDRYSEILSDGGVVAPERCFFTVTGEDRLRYLNGQLSNQVGQNHPVYALTLNAKGQLEGDLYVHDLGEQFLIEAAVELKESLPARLGKYIIADDVEIADASEQWELRYHLVGGSAAPDSPANNRRCLLPGNDSLHPCGEGAEATVSSEEFEILRILGGIPLWGSELETGMLPPNAGAAFLERSVSYEKGCYTGQEVISRMRRAGKTPKHLVSFLLEDDSPIGEAAVIVDEAGKEVGKITSNCLHPALDRRAGLGYVRTAPNSDGSVYSILETPTSTRQQTPFFPPSHLATPTDS